jgi:hypothetical protein
VRMKVVFFCHIHLRELPRFLHFREKQMMP